MKMVGNITARFDPWEVHYGVIESYLIRNCETLTTPVDIVDVNKRVVGQSISFYFKDSVEVVLDLMRDGTASYVVVDGSEESDKARDLSHHLSKIMQGE